MKEDRCKIIPTILKTTLTIFLLVVSSWWDTTFCFSYYSVIIPEKPKTIMDYCLEISHRLNDLGYISVSPEKFAEFMYKVSYCESGHKVKAKNGDQLGLWQMTADTRKKLKVRHGGLDIQAKNYYKFLAAGGKKLRWIKSSVDLHCYNFTPANFRKDTLSQVTNDGLRALDLDKDSIITRQDIILFQKKRLKA